MLPDNLPEKLPSVLIVDDEEDLLDILKYSFERAGYKTYAAIDVDSAVQILELEKIDFVLSDVCMPEKSGVDLLREINEKNISVQFCFFSGYSTISEEEAKSLGSFGILKKPMRFEELEKAIREIVSVARPTVENKK